MDLLPIYQDERRNYKKNKRFIWEITYYIDNVIRNPFIAIYEIDI